MSYADSKWFKDFLIRKKNFFCYVSVHSWCLFIFHVFFLSIFSLNTCQIAFHQPLSCSLHFFFYDRPCPSQKISPKLDMYMLFSLHGKKSHCTLKISFTHRLKHPSLKFTFKLIKCQMNSNLFHTCPPLPSPTLLKKHYQAKLLQVVLLTKMDVMAQQVLKSK